MLMCGPGGVRDAAVAVPNGREILRGDIPVASDQPRDGSQPREGILEAVEEIAANVRGLWGGGWWTIHTEEVKALGAGPGDNTMRAPGEGSSTMDLQGPTDENGRTSTAPLVAARSGRIPEAVPSRLTGQELETV